jgi:hypothetical protein
LNSIKQAMRLLLIILLFTLNNCFGQQKNALPKTLIFKSAMVKNQIKKPTVSVKPDFMSSKHGFVCRQEWKFEKKTKLPLKLRLGSIDYVNKMEGK